MSISSFQEIKTRVGQSETGIAIQKLSEILVATGKYEPYVRVLKVIEGHYNATRTKELKGITTFSEAQRDYNQINDTILQVISDIESGKTTPSESVQSRSYRGIIIGGVLLVLAAFTAWFVLGREPKIDCPSFTGQGSKVLILPFKKISGADADVAILLQTRIQNLVNQKLLLDVKVLENFLKSAQNPDQVAAEEIAKDCGADFVVWGLYQGTGTNIQLRHFDVKKRISKDSGFQTIANVTDIIKDERFRSVDDAIFSLCASFASTTGDQALALRWLDKVQDKSSNDTTLKTRIEAVLQ